MKNNTLLLIGLFVMIVFNSCETYKHISDFKAFVYKPLDVSPAYVIKLPPNSNIETIIRGHSDCYLFSYSDAVFYISEEYPYQSQPQDTLYNFLLKMQQHVQKGERITIPSAGMVYESGGTDNNFWSYRLFYDFGKPNPLYGVSNNGFEHLYVGYVHASEKDTAVLNDCISSTIQIDKSVTICRANKIIKINRYNAIKKM